jgi:iron complex outermembrane receptor protein
MEILTLRARSETVLLVACPLILSSLLLSQPLRAQSQPSAPHSLADISIEDLMNVEVTTVSAKEQKLSNTAAAVYVINQEDIHRSGATNIPDLLRMVPGVDVAQIDSGHWAISIRGFSDLYANKVLVLVDGQSRYRSSTSGVFWDQMDMPIENIERIEVIRGPGGTVWGANAMNGVINIITKTAKDTRGGLVTANEGSRTTAGGLLQYGGALGAGGTFRVFEEYSNIANGGSAGETPANDGSHGFHAGFRSDWILSPRSTLTVQGDVDQIEGGQTLTDEVFTNALPLTASVIRDEIKYTSGNVLSRWNRTLANGSDISLQVSNEYFHSNHIVRESSNVFDVDFKYHLVVGSRHDVVWGLGYRTTESTIVGGFDLSFLPPQRTDNLFSAFVQDEIRLTSSLSLTLGSKFEHNAYTGFEYEPSGQLAWEISAHHTLWASASRAIRQPARGDFAIQVDAAVVPLGNGNFGVVQVLGTPDVKAEQLRDFEVGYRTQIHPRLSIDSTVFLSFYRNLEAFEPQDPFFTTSEGPAHEVFPEVVENLAYAHDYGAEIFATWSINHRWKLSPGFSALHMNLVDPSGRGVTQEDPGVSPRHTVPVRSFLNLSRNVDWDVSLSYVGRLTDTPGYARLDSRLGWRLGESLEVSVVGQNLLTPRHAEYPDQYDIAHTLVERTVFGKITWHY